MLAIIALILLIIILCIVIRNLLQTKSSFPQWPKPDFKHEQLVHNYGLAPAPSWTNLLLIGMLTTSLFGLYASFLAIEVSESYKNPSLRMSLQHFEQLEFPAMKFCADPGNNLKTGVCEYSPNDSVKPYAVNCTLEVSRTEHFVCIQPVLDDPSILVAKADTSTGQIAVRLHLQYSTTLAGFLLLLVRPNNTGDRVGALR